MVQIWATSPDIPTKIRCRYSAVGNGAYKKFGLASKWKTATEPSKVLAPSEVHVIVVQKDERLPRLVYVFVDRQDEHA